MFLSAERLLEAGAFPLRIQLEWDVHAEGRFVLKLDSQIPTSIDVFGDVATFKKADSSGMYLNVLHLCD